MKIGFISDSPLFHTGYAKVALNLGKQLSKLGHEISYCPMQYMGRPLDIGFAKIYEGSDAQTVQRYLDMVHPDVIVHIRDSYVMSTRYGGKEAVHLFDWCLDRDIKFINYSPVHASPLTYEEVLVAQEKCHLALTMSVWGRDLYALQGVGHNHIDYLYHGVDRAIFKPMDKQACRKEFGFPQDVPIIGSVAMNFDFRKMIPVTMMAFKELLKTVPNAKLVLWTEPVAFWDLEQWVVNLNIRDSVYFSSYDKTWGASEDQMAKLYNCFDVYINTATSEGFGLPLLEAQACGVPIVCTDTPVLREIFPSAYFITSSKSFPQHWGSMEWLADYKDGARQLSKALTERRVNDNTDYSWERAAIKLDSICEDMVNRKWSDGITDAQLASSEEHESFLREDMLMYPRWAMNFPKDVIPKQSVFVDIGAHAGRWSVRASKYYSKVIAVEPFPETLGVLMENISLNDVAKNVDVRGVAISDHSGTLKLFKHKYHGWISAHDRADGEASEIVEVPCATLDEFVAQVGVYPDVIKIDVEAHELAVLAGGVETLSRKPKLIIEVHDEAYMPRIRGILTSHGYTKVKEIKDSWHSQTCTYVVASQ